MGVIIKRIGRREYAYLVAREGKRVKHTYLGPADGPKVIKIISDKKETSAIPARFRPLFWDTSLSKIHIKINARYIIERVLEFGNMDAVKWLQKVYSFQTVINILNMSRIITDKSRNFWLIWFGVTDA
ncbi:MAG: hypothetical protein A2Y97_04740 [Nitrospirae bacterium RBG_13_39_12]|nr:MAG: hypothetical protein A2Y97_04740 [Nitrospirae bacterium RBG_13_39_12]